MKDAVWTINLTINNVSAISLGIDAMRQSHLPPLMEDDVLKD